MKIILVLALVSVGSFAHADFSTRRWLAKVVDVICANGKYEITYESISGQIAAEVVKTKTNRTTLLGVVATLVDDDQGNYPPISKLSVSIDADEAGNEVQVIRAKGDFADATCNYVH